MSSTAIYEIQFFTTTTGVIDKIDITFPAGTGVALAGIIERVGITGPGVITKSGTTVTLDLNTPVSVPAGTFVRLEMVDISNPPNPANYEISVTTKNPSNVPIDGPSLSPAYTIRQVSTGMIADGAVSSPKIANGAITPTKPAESFMKRVTLRGNTAGHLRGWDPDGMRTTFTITEIAIISLDESLVNSWIRTSGGAGGIFNCQEVDQNAPVDTFELECETGPPINAELHYVVENVPPHLV